MFDEEELREHQQLRDANMFIVAHGCMDELVDTSLTQNDVILTELHDQLICEGIDVVPNCHLISASIAAGLPPNFQMDAESPCGLYFEGSAAKLIHERPREPNDDEVLIIYISKEHIKRSVIGRMMISSMPLRSSSTNVRLKQPC